MIRFYFSVGSFFLFGGFVSAIAQLDSLAIIHVIEQQRCKKDSVFKCSPDSPLPDKYKKSFHGLSYFAINLKFRFEGSVHRDEKSNAFEIIASDGRKRKALRYGSFAFQVEGRAHRLQLYKLLDLKPQYSNLIFLPFTDVTSGHESYAGGRYIDLEERRDNQYVIDFNLSYNPSCAYGKKGYSCPLPPAENRLPIRIEAGEKKWEYQHD